MAPFSVEEYRQAYNDCFGAAWLGDLDRLKELAEEKANGGDLAITLSSCKCERGRSIFHYAAITGRKRIFKYLIEELGLNVDDFTDNEGFTPLHTAVIADQYNLAVYLLDKGANPNASDNCARTPLHMAAKMGPRNILEYLTAKGAEIDAKSDEGTPLQLAASDNRKDVMKVLLDNHANPDVTYSDLCSPLHSSIMNGSIQCVKLLLLAGADPNFVSLGDTPLGIAASTGGTEIIMCLLNAGADPNVRNLVGKVPIEVAASLGKREAVSCLLPVTSCISYIADWSVYGIVNYFASKDNENKKTEEKKKHFSLSKSKGEEAFKRRDYREAKNCYTEALYYDPEHPYAAAVYSNRSLCWTRLNRGHLALADALSCLKLRPEWPKSYYRMGWACMVLKFRGVQVQRYKDAADAFLEGWKLDLNTKELEHAFQLAIEAQREGST